MLATFLFAAAMAAFVSFFPLCQYSFILFDRWLRLLHERHHEEWVRCGRPIGFLLVPKEPEVSTWRGGWARSHVWWTWMAGSSKLDDPEMEALRRKGSRLIRWGWLMIPL